MTGSFSPLPFAVVQTFRYKQSSLKLEGPPIIVASCLSWMQPGANASAFLTPLHGLTGWGAFHRSSPTGDAANGTPLNEATLPFTTPCTSPPVTVALDI